MDSIKLLQELSNDVQKIEYQDWNTLDACNQRIEMVIRNIFGDTSNYLTKLRRIRFSPMMSPSSQTYEVKAWKSGLANLNNLINTMIEEKRMFGKEEQNNEEGEETGLEKEVTSENHNSKIFIVHGHDDAMKHSVARTIEKLELNPVILHEEANQGRNILEKFMGTSDDVNFSIVLLSPDDLIVNDNDNASSKVYRARQNVIFELGYFIGKLGKDRVVALYKEEADRPLELPTDYQGVLFIPYKEETWKLQLVKELNSAHYQVDANKIL